MIELVFHNQTKNRRLGRRFFEQVVKTGFSILGLNVLQHWSLSVALVEPAEIQRLNRQHRFQNKATDVLSFPLQRFDNIFKFSSTSAIIDLGDIFLCPKIIVLEAKANKESLDQRLALLTIHGLLHLLSFDHQLKKDYQEMKKWEDKILKELAMVNSKLNHHV